MSSILGWWSVPPMATGPTLKRTEHPRLDDDSPPQGMGRANKRGSDGGILVRDFPQRKRWNRRLHAAAVPRARVGAASAATALGGAGSAPPGRLARPYACSRPAWRGHREIEGAFRREIKRRRGFARAPTDDDQQATSAVGFNESDARVGPPNPNRYTQPFDAVRPTQQRGL
jgi:hypothetical protein